MRSYRLPNQQYTRNVDLYCDSWRELADKTILAMGWDAKLSGFDPGFLFTNGRSLDTDIAMKLVELYEKSQLHRHDGSESGSDASQV